MNITRTSILIIPLLALTGCVDREAQEQGKKTEELIKDQTTVVEVMQLSSSTVSDTINITGAIETSDDVSVTALVGGALIAVYVKDGDEVTAGQVIAKQDDESFVASVAQTQAQSVAAKSVLDQAKADAEVGPQRSSAKISVSESRLEQARARLQKLLNGARPEERRQAEAAVQKAESDRDTAKLAVDRAKRLFGEGAIAKSALELAENSYASTLAAYSSALEAQRLVQNSSREEDVIAAREDVRAAEYQLSIDKSEKRLDVLYVQRVESAEANWNASRQALKLAQIALNNTSLRSPFTGRISGKPLQIGSYVQAGVPIARVVGVGSAYFEAEIPESKIAILKIGMQVEVTLDALPGMKISGSLSAISPQATGAGRLFLARIQLDSIPDGVRSGMFARGTVTLEVRSGVHLMPSEAIVRDGEDTYVFLFNDKKASRVKVETGKSHNGSTEVTGLKNGDTVIVKGQTSLADGSSVKLEDTTEEAKEA